MKPGFNVTQRRPRACTAATGPAINFSAPSHSISPSANSTGKFIVLSADHQHQRAMEMLDHLRQHRQVTREEQQARWKQVRDRHQAVKQALYDDTKLAEAADDAIKELMAGGKISL